MSSRNTSCRLYALGQLYQIGIRCLAATNITCNISPIWLYQIGIRCLAATQTVCIADVAYYIKLELDV